MVSEQIDNPNQGPAMSQQAKPDLIDEFGQVRRGDMADQDASDHDWRILRRLGRKLQGDAEPGKFTRELLLEDSPSRQLIWSLASLGIVVAAVCWGISTIFGADIAVAAWCLGAIYWGIVSVSDTIKWTRGTL
jgi:hypothetical protein